MKPSARVLGPFLALASCEPLLADLDFPPPKLELSVSEGPRVGSGVDVSVRIDGCAAGELQMVLDGVPFAEPSFSGCSIERGCTLGSTLSGAAITETLGPFGLLQSDRGPSPCVGASGRCLDFGRSLGPVSVPLGPRLFEEVGPIPEVATALFATPQSSGLALHAATSAGTRTLGFANPRGPADLSGEWVLWNAGPEILTRAHGSGGLLVGLFRCRTAGACAAERTLRAVDWDRKLRSIPLPASAGANPTALLAAGLRTWVRTDAGLVELNFRETPAGFTVTSSHTVPGRWSVTRDGGSAWRLDEGVIRWLHATSEGLREASVGPLDPPIVRVDRVFSAGEGAWLVVQTENDAEPRWLILDRDRDRRLSVMPRPEGVAYVVPRAPFLWVALSGGTLERWDLTGPQASFDFPGQVLQESVPGGEDLFLATRSDDLEGTRRLWRLSASDAPPELWIDDLGTTVQWTTALLERQGSIFAALSTRLVFRFQSRP
ncbi:MAG: hypothetical protein AAFU79_02235 [Myxococcota bacterium]